MNDSELKKMIPDCLNWEAEDFKFLKLHSKADNLQLKSSIVKIRLENLCLLSEALKDFNIPYWLFGKTLFGFYYNKGFIVNDHDDDIGVFYEDRVKVCNILYPKLKKAGFQAIRHNDAMLTVIRNNRYIDICFFRKKEAFLGYGEKWVPKLHFENFEQVNCYGHWFPIPNKTAQMLVILYPEKELGHKNILTDFLSKYHRRLKRKIKKHKKNLRNIFLTKTVIRPLTYEEFLTCKIEADKAINWILRAPHLSMITDNGNNRKISEIVGFFKNSSNLNMAKKNIKEVDTSKEFEEPINLNSSFWLSGNNFLFYCIFYRFKKNVLPYNKANSYISAKNLPLLYSADYFDSLPQMSDDEVKDFLKKHPVTISKGAIEHGKHRACAMIGRLISGKSYIPIYVEEKKNF